MRTKALWFLLIMTVSLTLTLACGTADEPAAESPGPPSPGAAQTTDAITPAGSGESAGGAAGAETTGTSSPRTDNSSMPLTVNPATGSQDSLTVNPSAGTQDAVPGQPAVQQPTSVPPAPAEAEPEPTAEPTPTPFRPSAEGDRAILAELYHATNGDSWADNENWLSEQPLGEWYGVGTEGDRVVRLDLAANDLSGTLPARLWLMNELRQLYLEDNELTGEIPKLEESETPENYRFPQMTSIDLAGNQLSGCVPVLVTEMVGTNSADYGPLERCPHRDRQALEAFYNSTGGPNWTNQWNWLTDAPISQWGGVRATPDGKVTRLFLNVNNNLNGPIPPEIGKLEDLEILEIASKYDRDYQDAWRRYGSDKREGKDILPVLAEVKGNRITGPLPQELFTLKKLRILSLKTTGLTGQLPAELAKLESLETLVLSDNLFEGRIPPEFQSFQSLTELNLSRNLLSEEIPPELGSMKQLLILILSTNQLSGTIPQELGNLPALTDDNNEVLGTINLGDNQLTGQIPPSLGNLKGLKDLGLSGNQLTGQIPPSLGNLKRLSGLYLTGNMLSGEIPRELAKMDNLGELFLAGNMLSGEIPRELAKMDYLQHLWLSHNMLSGELPRQLAGMENLNLLEINNNQLTGDIPAEFAENKGLKLTAFENNFNN